MPDRKITGFQFQVREKGRLRWVRLQGSGGLMGDGMLHALQDKPPPKTTMRRLLGQANRELRSEGYLLEWRGDKLPPGKRIRRIRPTSVEQVKGVYRSTPKPKRRSTATKPSGGILRAALRRDR